MGLVTAPATPVAQVFNYTRRGLFDRDKLIVLTLLTFNIGAPRHGRAQPAAAGRSWRGAYSYPAAAVADGGAAVQTRSPPTTACRTTGLRSGTIDTAEYDALCKGTRRWGARAANAANAAARLRVSLAPHLPGAQG